jgi:hypothetical protein
MISEEDLDESGEEEEISDLLNGVFPYRVNVVKGRNKNVVNIEVESWSLPRGIPDRAKRYLRKYKCQVVNIVPDYGKYFHKCNVGTDRYMPTTLVQIELGANTRLQQAKETWEEVIVLDKERHRMLWEAGRV